MIGEWEAPVQRLAQQLEDLKLTLKSIDQSKNQLRPELERMTIELTGLIGAKNSKVEPLLEFPRILKSILSNKQVGAMVFGPDGEKLLYNERAQFLLSGLGDITDPQNRDYGFFKGDGATHFQGKELPWVEALSGNTKKLEDTEMIVKRPGKEDQPLWLRVTVSTLAGAESGEIGGAIAFLADITEHVAVVNELSAICGELEQKLNNFTLASKELEMLSRKLSQVRSQDMELANQASKDNPNTSPRKLASKGRVLVADDVAVNQKLLKLQLERMGFEVDLAKSGVEAVAAAKSTHFDLILMDCDMPELDGYEATKQIRALEQDNANVPIIAVTAYDREGDREKCMASGMNDFITKGSPEKLLRQSIAKWINAPSNFDPSSVEDDSEAVNRARVVLFDEDKGENRSLTVDINDLEDTYGGSETESILRLFLGVSSTFVECLELAVESKDAEAVSHFAYSLKGPCASLNLTHLAALATQLSQLGVNGKWSASEETYQQLKSAYAPVHQQVSEILAQLPATSGSTSNVEGAN